LDEIDYGDWTGRRFEDLRFDDAWNDWNERRSLCRPPGGESMCEMQGRIVSHIECLCDRYPSGQIILVSHCDVIRAALLHYAGRPLDAYHTFDIAPASVSALHFERQKALVLELDGARITLQ
jgi:probable phosphoglycerate mutase